MLVASMILITIDSAGTTNGGNMFPGAMAGMKLTASTN